VRIGDAEGAKRWKEKEVEYKSRNYRGNGSLDKSPRACHQKHQQQIGKPCGGCIDMENVVCGKSQHSHAEERQEYSPQLQIQGFTVPPSDIVVSCLLQGR